MNPQNIRNIGVIAHVDHGKTTLVHGLLEQTNSFGRNDHQGLGLENSMELQRGITILAKNTSILWKDHCINIIDTPGHADFGGEVERILSMVDSVLLIVDALEGPMPQTRFVTQKAFAHGLHPIVVINKIDRPGVDQQKIQQTISEVFDLFVALGASDEQADFSVIYASGLNGFATLDLKKKTDNLHVLLDWIIDHVPAPDVDIDGPFQMQISALDYSSYVGAMAIGRVHRGRIRAGAPVCIIDNEGQQRSGKVLQILQFRGKERFEIAEACAGQIVCVTGIEDPRISETICHPKHPEARPKLYVDMPTVSVMFCVNTSPMAGREGKFVTSRQLYERLQKELLHNVALRVENTDDSSRFKVSGRGELHLSILMENMRREGYEFAISRPEVILKEMDGEVCEPYEQLEIEVDFQHQGAVMSLLGPRKAQLLDMEVDENDRMHLRYLLPTRGLMGLQNEFMTLTSGSGIWSHSFSHYAPYQKGMQRLRNQGAMIASSAGISVAYALWNLQERGRLFIGPQVEVYEGMVIGMSSKEHDMVVNVLKAKALTNIRAAGSDENILLTPPIQMDIEQAMQWINPDELVEVTPSSIRIRKRHLKEHERKREARHQEDHG